VTIDEGYTKFVCDWQRCKPPQLEDLSQLCVWRRPLFEAGLIGIYGEHGIGFGNISARIGSGSEFLISGTQTGHIADAGAEHFSLVTHVDAQRNSVRCRGPVQASSESMTHAALYGIAEGINAVVHIHSDALWNIHIGVLPTTSQDIAYGTPDMAAEFERIYRETSFSKVGIAVMGGHESGLISIGRNLEEAAMRILTLQDSLQAN
jgi:ribulose-5-phosphate 4-epimerase/fuculose-1-phosphate aldolase